MRRPSAETHGTIFIRTRRRETSNPPHFHEGVGGAIPTRSVSEPSRRSRTSIFSPAPPEEPLPRSLRSSIQGAAPAQYSNTLAAPLPTHSSPRSLPLVAPQLRSQREVVISSVPPPSSPSGRRWLHVEHFFHTRPFLALLRPRPRRSRIIPTSLPARQHAQPAPRQPRISPLTRATRKKFGRRGYMSPGGQGGRPRKAPGLERKLMAN